MNIDNTRHTPPADGHLIDAEVAATAATLDALGARDRAAVNTAMCERIARASMAALAARGCDDAEAQRLAAAAAALDAQGRRDRALVGAAMTARTAAASAPALAGETQPAVLATIGFRRWRLAAAVAIAAVGLGATAMLLNTPTPGPDPIDPSDIAFEAPTEPAESAEWTTTLTLDTSRSLSEFDANIVSAANLLDDPWGQIDDLFSEGAL